MTHTGRGRPVGQDVRPPRASGTKITADPAHATFGVVHQLDIPFIIHCTVRGGLIGLGPHSAERRAGPRNQTLVGPSFVHLAALRIIQVHLQPPTEDVMLSKAHGQKRHPSPVCPRLSISTRGKRVLQRSRGGQAPPCLAVQAESNELPTSLGGVLCYERIGRQEVNVRGEGGHEDGVVVPSLERLMPQQQVVQDAPSCENIHLRSVALVA
mmetsp:Transcript_64044/g.147541  ORF Transcript_64044/g.147541 Transcript_64044/m.147541 type:complete len:211 (+) Transcript_64044:875-1507(+)